jgi:hypothetical protein
MATNKAIVELGHEALTPDSKEVPDIQIVFAGMEFHKPRYKARINGKFKSVWMYARPSQMSQHIGRLKQFDQVYSLTNRHAEMFEKATGFVTKPLHIASDKKYKPATKPYAFDIAYMGTKVDYRLKSIVELLSRGYKVVVCGFGWTRGIKHANLRVAGQFWPNEDFSGFYNQAPLSIYPMKSDYQKYGIVPIRIMDIYVSSDCMCLAPVNRGLMETFVISPPQYENTQQLIQIVDFFLKNPDERKQRQSAIRESTARTYKDLVLDVITDAMEFWSKK